jgi:RNA polymerase sigma factor for flagellar operon FliA
MTSGDIPADPWPLIERVMARVARRQALSPEEAEDFQSWARLRLLEGTGAPLAKFQGKSTIETYLAVVILNLFRDYRIAKWGKWRPSAAARRLGPAAIRLETLMFRDGLSTGEAVAVLGGQLAGSMTSADIETLAARLPSRSRPRLEREEALQELAAPASGSERTLVARELEPKVRKAEQALRAALGRLPAQDRLILKLRFQEGLKIVDIARVVGIVAKNLYPRLERNMATLRRALEDEGLSAGDVRDLLDWDDLDLAVDYQVSDFEPRTGSGTSQTTHSPPARSQGAKKDRMSV